MKNKKLNTEFVLANYKKMSIRDMSIQLGVNHTTISMFMTANNLTPCYLYNRKRTNSQIKFTKEKKQYVRDNYKTKKVKDMCSEIGISENRVRKFMSKNKLRVLKHKVTEEHEQFILDNCKNMSKAEMLKHINVTKYYLDEFYKKNKLWEYIFYESPKKAENRRKQAQKRLLAKNDKPKFEDELSEILYDIEKSNNSNYEFSIK